MTIEAKGSSTHAKKEPAQSAQAATSGANGDTIVVDLGKRSRKQVRKLRKGKPGKLMERVEETIAHLREQETLAPQGQVVVIVVRERRSRPRVGKMFGMG